MRTKVPLGRAEKTTGSNNNNDRGPQRQRNVFSRAVCLSLHLCRPASAHSHTSYVIHSYHIVHAGWVWLRLAAKQAHTYCILPIKMLDASDDCEQRKQPERVLRFSIKHRSNIYAPSRRRLSTQVRRTPIWFLYREFLYINIFSQAATFTFLFLFCRLTLLWREMVKYFGQRLSQSFSTN